MLERAFKWLFKLLWNIIFFIAKTVGDYLWWVAQEAFRIENPTDYIPWYTKD